MVITIKKSDTINCSYKIEKLNGKDTVMYYNICINGKALDRSSVYPIVTDNLQVEIIEGFKNGNR